MTPTLRPYVIACAGLQYVALATGPGQAIADALALHGQCAVSARPLRTQGGAA
jgi:hypothetical protein